MESHAIQFSVAIICGILFFFFIQIYYEKAYFFLITIIPFQLISSRYGSLNFALSLVFWVSLLFQKKNGIKIPWPVTLSFFIIPFCMVPPLYGIPRMLLKSNFVYIYDFMQNFIMMMLAVQYLEDEDRMIKLFYILAFSNVLVLGFTILQTLAGTQGIMVGGIEELTISSRIDDKARLLGPFGSSQAFVLYLIIQSMICMYALLTFAKAKKYYFFWFLLLFCNVGTIVGTGTRSGYLGFCVSLLLMFMVYIKHFGLLKSIRISIIGTLVLVSMTFVVIRYTKYNTMLDRLSGTEVIGMEVDSRVGLVPMYWEQIQKKPIFGHRPRVMIDQNQLGGKSLSNHTEPFFYASPPHNFYLYVLFSTGMAGLGAHLLFLFILFGFLFSAQKRWDEFSEKLKYLPLLFMAVFVLFLIMQFFISYIRFSLSDFQDYLFTLFGLMLSAFLIPQRKAARHEVK